MRTRLSLLFSCVILLVLACDTGIHVPYQYHKHATGKSVVVSVHPLATQAGIDILKRGGNAIDAAVAVHLALAVVYPRAGNIGGGGFMVYRMRDGASVTLDFREKAALNASRDMFLDTAGNVISGLSTEGHLAVGVPGSVAGLVAAHEKYGSLPWKTLCDAAIRLARDGYPITQFEADRMNETKSLFIKHNGIDIPFVRDSMWYEGDMIVQAELAQTLERIQADGLKGFYSGETARLLLQEIARGEGIITQQDLDSYRPEWRKPLITQYKHYRIIGMPPPSSGGIAVAQLLEMVRHYPIAQWGQRDLRTIHLMAEAERRAFADRAEHLGDPDFYTVPMDSLLNANYLAIRMEDFSPDSASHSVDIRAGVYENTLESYETTHYSIVDKYGNAVAITTTLNNSYGSKVYVHGAGFFLNDEMDDFSVKPGVPNYYGLIGDSANAIQPGKRMLSSMTPTIVEKNGVLFMTIGTPGGSTIITSVFQVFLNVAEFNMTATDAVASLRFHHQWLPDEIKFEAGCFTDSLKQELIAMGHHLNEIRTIGTVEVIHAIEHGMFEGVADPRESSEAGAVK